jgi:chloride channel 3/4/5
MREILSASSAAGVAVAFGSPIGGVLFSLEEMSANFPNKTMLRSFFCALIATMVLQVSTGECGRRYICTVCLLIKFLQAMNPFRTGKLVMFQVTYDRDWHFFEYFFTVIIGIFGVSKAMYASMTYHNNLIVCSVGVIWRFRHKV